MKRELDTTSSANIATGEVMCVSHWLQNLTVSKTALAEKMAVCRKRSH